MAYYVDTLIAHSAVIINFLPRYSLIDTKYLHLDLIQICDFSSSCVARNLSFIWYKHK